MTNPIIPDETDTGDLCACSAYLPTMGLATALDTLRAYFDTFASCLDMNMVGSPCGGTTSMGTLQRRDYLDNVIF